MVLAFPGSETTANALSYAVYLLSRHPEAEAKLTAEVDALGGRRANCLLWRYDMLLIHPHIDHRLAPAPATVGQC